MKPLHLAFSLAAFICLASAPAAGAVSCSDLNRPLTDRLNPTTAAQCAEAGATWFVAGSAIFGADDPAAAYREIVAAAGC